MADEAVRPRPAQRYAAGVEALCGLNLPVQTGQSTAWWVPTGLARRPDVALAGVLFPGRGHPGPGAPVPDGWQVRHHIGYLPQRFSLTAT